MKRSLVLLSSCLLCSPAVAGGIGPSDRAELEGFVDGAMQALMQSHAVPGATISVVKDGEILFAKGYGYADVEQRVPVDAQKTMFRIASISKLFAWTALMQLAERGDVDLDKDVNAYLDFEIPPTFPQPITSKHLLTHTAGFEDRYHGLFAEGIEDLGPLGEILANNIPARVAPPGREAAYSNYSAALAGYIVERVSGMPFAQYVEEKIYAPLGMAYSTFREPVPSNLERHLSTGYAYRGGAFEAQDFEYDPGVADGAMSSSAVDMARFMIAHLQDGRYGAQRILREQTARQMRRRIFTHDPRVAGIAHGFCEIDLNGQLGIGHGGDLLYFHSDLLLLPEHDFGVFVSFNSESGGAARDEILPLLLDRYYPTTHEAPAQPSSDFQARASRYAGHYRVNRRPYESLEKAASLLAFGDVTVSVWEPGVLLVDFMGEQARLEEIEPLLFRVAGGGISLRSDRVAFAEDASGHITHAFPTPVLALHKLAWYDTLRFHLALLASCLVIFAAASVGAIWRLRAARPEASRDRWRYRLTVALSAVNVAFLVGFGFMLAGSLETALIPESVLYLLVLPVLSALLTLCVVFLLAWGWRSVQSGRERFSGVLFGLAALAYLWFLDYWNLLGWHY